MLEFVIIAILGIATGFIFVKAFIFLLDIRNYLRKIYCCLMSFESAFRTYADMRLSEAEPLKDGRQS